MKRLALWLLPAVLTACPGGDTPLPPAADLAMTPAPDLSPPPPPERAYDACVAFYKAGLGRFEQCGVGLYSFPQEGYIAYQCTRLQQRVDGGTARYDKSKLASCLQTSAAAGCNAGELIQLLSPDDCGVFSGTRAAGAGCFDAIECQSGSCDTSAACPGTCRAVADVGQSCVSTSCKTGLFCNSMMTPATCVVLPTANQPCLGTRCALGLYCDAGTCKAPRTSGPCLQPGECALGTRCVGAMPPNTMGQCLAYKKLQEPCSDDTDCASGLQCADGLCYTYPKAGGSCGKLLGHSRVIGCLDSYCDAATDMPGRCQARLAEGQFCSRDDQCVADNTCVSSRCKRTACAAFR